MLALIYSEILKTLRLWSLLDFDCEIFFPHDNHGLPRGYHKQKSKESDHQHILTSLTLLEKVGCVFSCCLLSVPPICMMKEHKIGTSTWYQHKSKVIFSY